MAGSVVEDSYPNRPWWPDAPDQQLLADRVAAEFASPQERLALAFLFGATASRNQSLGRRTCRICGCWEHAACVNGCSWAGIDLCSTCATPTPPETEHGSD